MDEQIPDEPKMDFVKSLPAIAIVFLILTAAVYLSYLYSKPRPGSVVLPGGITYLGPSPTTAPNPNRSDADQSNAARFTAEPDAVWTAKTSAKYGYTFSVPASLPIEPFLTDEFDAYAITWNNATKESNVLIGVENLSGDQKKAAYVNKSKKDYIESFWAGQYNLAGIKTLASFTTAKGLKGYRVKFQTTEGVSPFDDVFLEVQGKPNLLIHLSNAILEPAVFEQIVQSISWPS
jgi:hypothetical protein